MALKGKGRILKIRMGYNANSSSIASVVKALIWGSTTVILMTNMVSAVIFSKISQIQTNDGRLKKFED